MTSTLEIQFVTLAPLVVTGSAQVTVNGSGPNGHLTSLQIPSSALAVTNDLLPITDPSAFPIASIQLTVHNGAGNFAGSGGAGFGGTMPLLGTAKICLYGACGSSNNISNLSVPLSVVGQGGFITPPPLQPVKTVTGAPWTTGTAAVGTMTRMGGVSPLSNTAAASGTVTLVTPIVIRTSIGAFAIIPAFATLTLHFVPEPGTLLLLGPCIAALAWAGRARRA